MRVRDSQKAHNLSMKLLSTYRTSFFVLLACGTCFLLYLSVPNLRIQYSDVFDGLSTPAQQRVYVSSFESFRDVDFEFLKLLKEAGILVFLIEPRILVNLLNDQDLELLKKREINVENFSTNGNLTAYGTFEKHGSYLNKKLIETFKSKGYLYGNSECFDARLFHWDERRIRNVTITSHHFFAKSGQVSHLVVFYKRNRFLWSSAVASLPSSVYHLVKKEDLVFGRNATAFEKFDIAITRNGSRSEIVEVPSDIKQFLFEIPSSTFLECNHGVAREFYAKNWEEGKPNAKFDEMTVNVIAAVKDLLRPFLIPFWICSGTLLGWYRQCDVIPYTSDIDLAGWARDIDPTFESMARKDREKFVLKYIYGIPSESYQYAFYYSRLRVDFFFTYKGRDNYWYGGHQPKKGVYFHYNYPKFSLCSAELVGHKVQLPCNAEKVVSMEYGENWKSLVKNWSYDHSAFNIGPKISWPKEIAKKTYIVV